jgi:hypothetical protein
LAKDVKKAAAENVPTLFKKRRRSCELIANNLWLNVPKSFGGLRKLFSTEPFLPSLTGIQIANHISDQINLGRTTPRLIFASPSG